ncbi:hypothetical protein SY89_00425 [Halolamina pelagica]|uniref:MTH-967-like PD-(D/E)XK domain-containing protein n=1 Tax=Halolamina pelagica TaxID=699431 RepID=A0A0P7H893_9EURY|nr:hypothetical protein SY89_00425 [Halolamina pelagica]
MSRTALIENVTAMLQDAGFLVSERCAIRPKSFDVAARRGEELVLLKVLGNVDAFDAATGQEMRRLGEYLSATPMVVGMRTRDEELKPEVVYFRHGVPAIHPDTAFDLFVEDVPPLIYAAPAASTSTSTASCSPRPVRPRTGASGSSPRSWASPAAPSRSTRTG